MNLQSTEKDIQIQSVCSKNWKELWKISYGPSADLEWKKWDGPYFQDPILSWEEFSTGFGKDSINNSHRGIIYYQGQLVGMVTAYWEDDRLQQWLEFGIVLYNSSSWNQGIGKEAVKLWIPYLFSLYPHIQRVGYTTWSGNLGMMTIGERLGMTLEARIRKVRFTQGRYFDSIKYGILRSEWL